MGTDQEVERTVEDALSEQARIDSDRAAMADEIVAGQRIDTTEDGRRFSRAWIITAAQHAANETYYRGERDRLLQVILRASDQLYESAVDDAEHQIQSHADTLPVVFRRVVAGHAAALETLQRVVRELILITEELAAEKIRQTQPAPVGSGS
jgi:hypothetical protein